MSEETKKPRTVDDIRLEYQTLCTKAGHIQYQLFTLENDLKIMNDQMRNLNVEAATLSAKEEEKSNA